MWPKPFKRWIKQYLNFSKKDRNAVLTLSILIVLMLIGHIAIDNVHLHSDLDHTKVKKALAEWNNLSGQNAKKYSLFRFNPNKIPTQQLDSLKIPDFIKRNIVSYRQAGGKFKRPEDVRKIYGMNDSIYAEVEKYILIPLDSCMKQIEKENIVHQKPIKKKLNGYFDPNLADISTLLQYGFNRFQAANLIKYREKGGTFYEPDDLLRIYGIDSVFYSFIENNIQIHSLSKEMDAAKTEKTEPCIELNNADSVELVKLYGIGPVFASRILKFRDLLGGFHSKNQLLEVYNLPSETYYNIEKNIETDTTAINKMRLNFAEFGELLRHPYLEKEDVKAIVNFRERNGTYNSVSQLNTEGVIDVKTYRRIRPYLSCR